MTENVVTFRSKHAKDCDALTEAQDRLIHDCIRRFSELENRCPDGVSEFDGRPHPGEKAHWQAIIRHVGFECLATAVLGEIGQYRRAHPELSQEQHVCLAALTRELRDVHHWSW